MTAPDPEAVGAAVARLTSQRVEVRETHISWVYLSGDRAYKLKKPLVLPFLDYGTTERRREMCREEIRLNRRLAPDLYLGVRAIVPIGDTLTVGDEHDPGAIDYVVEMRRYDERQTLAATLSRGELTNAELADVARRLASFHRGCPRASAGEHGSHEIERELDRNVEELLAVASQRSERERIRALARFLTAFVGSRSEALDARAASGSIRDCHGDLRAEHVVLAPEVCVVDCVEFDAALRTLDVADDLAFLVMDLTALGGEHFGRLLAEAYRAAGGDPGDDALLSFFAVHRALVRAKVLLVRAAQLHATSRAHGHASSQARELLALAERFAWQARLPLAIVVCGAPASGKSHLAASLATASRLPHLSSDRVRKELAGVGPTTPAAPEYYTDEFGLATYAELGRRAGAEVAERGGVLVDATFRHRRDRNAFARAFAGAAPLLFVECVAPLTVLAQRAAARERDPARVSDATVAVVLGERAAWEPLDEIPADAHVTVRTDRTADAILGDLASLLDRRI